LNLTKPGRIKASISGRFYIDMPAGLLAFAASYLRLPDPDYLTIQRGELPKPHSASTRRPAAGRRHCLLGSDRRRECGFSSTRLSASTAATAWPRRRLSGYEDAAHPANRFRTGRADTDEITEFAP
jgi:hypothetical protein